jgi:hypothetical protein
VTSSSTAFARGYFAATLFYLGSSQLPNGLLQKAHFWVSFNFAIRLQYAPGAVIQ